MWNSINCSRSRPLSRRRRFPSDSISPGNRNPSTPNHLNRSGYHHIHHCIFRLLRRNQRKPLHAHHGNQNPVPFHTQKNFFQFGVTLLALFIIQLAIGIYAVVNFKDTTIQTSLKKIFDKHTTESQNMFDELQSAVSTKIHSKKK